MATPALQLYQRMARYPGGKRLFSLGVCLKAPYFATIRPRVLELTPERSRWTMRKRRRVHNHIGTVHALATGMWPRASCRLEFKVASPPRCC